MNDEEEHGGVTHRVRAFVHKHVPAKYVHAVEHYGHVIYLAMVAIFAHGPYDVVAGGLAAFIVVASIAGYGEEV